MSVIALDCPVLTINVVRRGLNLQFRLTTKVIRKYQYEASNLASLEAGLLKREAHAIAYFAVAKKVDRTIFSII